MYFETKIINMEKTVLNQLLEWCKEFDDKNYYPTHTNMKEKIWQLLPKEKEQMCNTDKLNEAVSLLDKLVENTELFFGYDEANKNSNVRNAKTFINSLNKQD